MRYQDFIIAATREAFEATFKYARHVQADKVEWVPMGEARTVLSICQELTKCPDWALDMMSKSREEFEASMADPKQQENSFNEYLKEREAWPTVDECYKVGKEKMDRFLEFLKTFPDERLSEAKWLPYDGGRDFPATEQMAYPLWNFQYHQGQIAYIETLYGDKSMP